MTDISLIQILIVMFVMLLAGIVKGTIGMGLPLIGSSLLALFYPPLTILSIIAPTIFVTNFLQAFRAGHFLLYVKSFWPLIIFMLVFMAITAFYVTAVNPRWIYFSLGIALLLFLLSQLNFSTKSTSYSGQFVRNHPKIWGAFTGIIAGVIGGLSSAWSPPVAIYCHWLNLDKQAFIRTLGWSFLIGSVPLNISYLANGVINTNNFPLALTGLITALFAFMIGERLRQRINEALFKKCILSLLTVMCVNFFYKFLTY